MSKPPRKSVSRPLSAPSTPHPHWAPQTPHGTRAVQLQLQRSGNANAKTNRRKSGKVQKPWSTRRTLRALSKAALNEPSRLRIFPDPPSSKRLSRGEEKENDLQLAKSYRAVEADDDEEEQELRAKRPRLSLPIDQKEDDAREGTPLPEAPTPSVLHEGDEESENPTLKSIEYGRRAVSEGPVSRRFSRPSFGSIRMSDFTAADLKEYGISPSPSGKRLFQSDQAYDDNIMVIGDDEMGVKAAEDTGDVNEARQSLGFPDVNETSLDLPAVDQEDHDTFRLDFNIPERSPSFAGSGPNRDQRSNPSAASSPTSSPTPANGTSQQAHSFNASPSNSPSATPVSSPDLAPEPTLQPHPTHPPKSRKRKCKLSRHNLKVLSLPSSLQKRLANSALSTIGRHKSKIGKDSLRAIEQATEWFFEQVGEDLEAYSDHAGRRKRVDEADVAALMRRQRHVDSLTRLEDLAREHLPRELRKEIGGRLPL